MSIITASLEMDFVWTKDYPEIWKICNLFQLKELKSPVRSKYTALTSILQKGPICGLVALAMSSEDSSEELVEKLLRDAKKLNFTNNGEMFSAKNLCRLAQNTLKNKFVKLYDGLINSEYIKEFLFDGGMMLVPYDCDKNHSPALKNGSTAHWAIVSGIVESDNGKFYILARHGKSQNIAIWNLEDLSRSNSQLNDYPPKDEKLLMIPTNGLDSPNGLKNKAVLISNNYN